MGTSVYYVILILFLFLFCFSVVQSKPTWLRPENLKSEAHTHTHTVTHTHSLILFLLLLADRYRIRLLLSHAVEKSSSLQPRWTRFTKVRRTTPKASRRSDVLFPLLAKPCAGVIHSYVDRRSVHRSIEGHVRTVPLCVCD